MLHKASWSRHDDVAGCSHLLLNLDIVAASEEPTRHLQSEDKCVCVCVSVCLSVCLSVCVCVCVCACITHLMLTGNLDQRLVGLCCKFLCWGDDHCTNAVVARKQLAVQFLHKRHKKGKGLSRPGLGSTKHILSCQGVFQGCFLNPCWFHESGACET